MPTRLPFKNQSNKPSLDLSLLSRVGYNLSVFRGVRMTFHLHQDRLHRITRSFLFWLTRVLMSILTRWQVKGEENVPQQGPLLVVANHLGHADQYLIKVSLNRRLFFMAKESLFRYQPLRFLVESWDVFPVRVRQTKS